MLLKVLSSILVDLDYCWFQPLNDCLWWIFLSNHFFMA